ncbi:MAG: hypothetical protein K8R36_09375 [Planctomycetales bacterium]|nr:hypothetical protein [Planctomycetales bacterium]
MGTLTIGMAFAAPPLVLPRESSAMREEQIRVSVRLARASFTPQRDDYHPERRHGNRDPFPYPVHLTPLLCDHRPDTDQTIIVIGRHLSNQGLDFYHHEPIPFRRAVVSLPTDGREWVSFLFELFWTRYNCHGWYDNGGRFLAAVPPLDLAA